MAVELVNSAKFEEWAASDRLVLLDFFAEWCGPCRMLAPVIEEIAKERPDVLVGKVNVDNEMELAQRFGIVSIPFLAVLRGGEVLATSVGYCDKDRVLAMLAQ